MRLHTDRHPGEGTLRRLLDEPAGVADADREHVAGCPQCLRGLAAARQDAAGPAAAVSTRGGAAAGRGAAVAAPAMSTAAAPDADAAGRRFAAASAPARAAVPARAGRW